MTELEEQLRRLAERADVRGPSAVFDAATEQDPPRAGIRSTRALVLVAVVAIAVVSVSAGLLIGDDAPRSLTADVPPFVDGALPLATDTVLVYDDGLEGVVVVDLDGRRVESLGLGGQRAGDQPFRLHRTGDALVFGWGEVFASDLDGTNVRSLGDATIFVPAVEEGSVWLVGYPGGRIGDGIPSLRRVTTDGEMVEASGGKRDDDDALPIRAVDGGMAYETPTGVVVWDPATSETTEPLPGAAMIGDVRGSLVAWCDANPCEAIHVTDLDSGADAVAANPSPAVFDLEHGRFSPDGSLLAVPAGDAIVLIDAATGEVDTTVFGPLPDLVRLAWTDDSRRLFFSSSSYGAAMLTLGVHDLNTEETATRLLPFGGTLGLVALPDTIGLALLGPDATRFGPCEVTDGSCPTTTTTTTTVPATTPSSPPNSEDSGGEG